MHQNAAFPASDGHKLLSLLHRPPTLETTEPWLLVLMHGVGSNEDDLFALADFVPGPFHVLSLRAPFVLGPGSYAWFEFSIEADGSRRIDADQETRSRAAVGWVPLTRDGGQQLGRKFQLYDMTSDKNINFR